MAVSERELMIKISGKVDNSLNTIGNKMEKEFQRMQKAAKALGAVGAMALTGATTAAVNVGMDYEAQMSTVEAISGASADEMARLEKMAQEMGATTKFTATESGQAMEYMAMAGWKSEQMLGGIEGIMELAAASGEDLATVSDIVTDALTAFNLTAEDSGHFADVLAKASSSSNTNVAMMGETFKYVAPVAGALKYSIEDTAVSIGLMANAGIKASQGGTTLRKIMNETAGGVELVSKAYAKNGEKTGKLKIEATNADGSMKDWSVTIGKLRKEFSKMTDEEKAANAESIAGKTAMAGLLAIVNASDADYKKLTQEINNAAGATKEMSDIRMDNLEGDITLLQSALQGKGIELYEEIKEPLRDLVQGATDWLSEIDVARVVDDFKDFGGAVVDFAEPFINVGEWMLDNPEVIEFIVAASGGLIGVGAAAEMAQRRMEEASLAEHFGEISLSMDQIRSSADDIIGGRKLLAVGNLLDSLDTSKSISRDMDKVAKNIRQLDWKLSLGLELSDEEMADYEENIKSYISNAQKAIEQKGYTIRVATDVLFGDTAEAKEIIKEDNAFFASLEKQASELSDKINKKLQKAMNDGITPKLQEKIDGMLEELSELTGDMSKAEAEASWATLGSKYSGMDLDEDSFKRMQDEVNENLEEVDNGAYEAMKQRNEYASLKLQKGKISEAEYEEELKTNKEGYLNQKADAINRASEFMYNTFMDTYGEDIAKGNMESGDWNALDGLLSSTDVVKKAEELKNQAIANDVDVSDDMEYVFKLEQMENASSGRRWQDAVGGLVNPSLPYEEGAKGADDASIREQAKIWEKGVAASNYDKFLPPEFQKNIDWQVPFLKDTAKEEGKKTAEEVMNTIQQELERGIQANVPITLAGSFSFNGTVPGSVVENSKTSGKTGGAATLFPPVPGHAAGIISNKEHIAAVSEGNKTEAIIPIDGSERSRRLYEATGKLMGAASQPPVTFAPHIEVNVSGNASSVDAKKIGAEVEKAAERAYRKMMRDEKRFRMG